MRNQQLVPIYTLTPNPTLDLGGFVDRVVPNEKNYIHHEIKSAGGNGINVARWIRRFGGRVVATGFLGGGIGREVKELLDQEDVKSHFIPIKNETRINLTISEAHSHQQTRLSFPGPKIQTEEKRKMIQFVSKIQAPAILVVGGSFPSGFSKSDLNRILKICQKNGIQTVIDCPGSILQSAVRYQPQLIKPNLTEFQDLVGRNVRTISAVIKEARELSLAVPLICVSSVEGGTLLIGANAVWFGKVPPLKIRSTVGAGDSMVAAMTFQISKTLTDSQFIGGWNVHWDEIAPQLLKWGLASSAASLSHPGTAMGSKSEVRRYYQMTKVHQVQSDTAILKNSIHRSKAIEGS